MKNINTLLVFLETVKGTPFEADLLQPMNIQGSNSSLGMYNLIVLIRDVKLFKAGIKPNRQFTMKTVKTYFGVKGNTPQILEQLLSMLEILKNNNIDLYKRLQTIPNIIIIDRYMDGFLITFKDFPFQIPSETKSEIFDYADSNSPYLITFK